MEMKQSGETEILSYHSDVDEDGIQLVAEILERDRSHWGVGYRLICKAVATDGGEEETIHIITSEFLPTLEQHALSFIGG